MVTPLQKDILAVIAKYYTYTEQEVKQVFKACGSYDNTIFIIQLATAECISLETAIKIYSK